MFPRVQERRALPGMIEEFASAAFDQFWDDERNVSVEAKQRLVPGVEDKVPWDLFILFGREASWADAQDHVLGWGEPVIDRVEKLDALLSSLGGKPAS